MTQSMGGGEMQRPTPQSSTETDAAFVSSATDSGIETTLDVPFVAPRTEDFAETTAPLRGPTAAELRRCLDESIAQSRNGGAVQNLGSLVERSDVRTDLGSFHTFPEYRTQYPETVIEALGELYMEYNRAFSGLVEANREWPTDYQYAHAADGTPVNYFVQIDMIGLPDAFLEIARDASVSEVKEALRSRIFEFENSLAMYQLLEKVCAPPGCDSMFKREFRQALDDIREQFGMPIALLACTDAKFEAMNRSEFGVMDGTPASPELVKELSGFDRFFSPEEFRRHVEENGGESKYLLFVRSSDPVAKLKDPSAQVDNPLLGDPAIRREIKAKAITFNVDAPDMLPEARINDTKGYLAPMKMAYAVRGDHDLLSQAMIDHLKSGKPYVDFKGSDRLAPAFVEFLEGQGVDPEAVASGELQLRAKPLKGTYGCYGHLTGKITKGDFRSELRKNIAARGEYVMQIEMQTPALVDSNSAGSFAFIDRNFMAVIDGKPRFMGGFRSLVPTDSPEARKGRIHGSAYTAWAEIF